jgi:hypothetical protein
MSQEALPERCPHALNQQHWEIPNSPSLPLRPAQSLFTANSKISLSSLFSYLKNLIVLQEDAD